MSLNIGSNLVSLTAASYLRTSKIGFDREMLRLATGFRINSASDDPAGAGLSARLEGQLGSTDGPVKNAVYSALSAVRDTDYAETSIALAQREVLMKAGMSVVSKANANRQYLLMLLQKKRIES